MSTRDDAPRQPPLAAGGDHLQQIALHARAASLDAALIPRDRIPVAQSVRYECDALAPDGTVEHYRATYVVPQR